MKYKKRFADSAEQNFYMNCIDSLLYGYGLKDTWPCGEAENRRKEIWVQALSDMADFGKE